MGYDGDGDGDVDGGDNGVYVYHGCGDGADDDGGGGDVGARDRISFGVALSLTLFSLASGEEKII